MHDRQGIDPDLAIREGELFPAILAEVRDDPDIDVLVLNSRTGKKGPVPLVTQLTKKFWLFANTNYLCAR